ncbi:catalase [Pseudoalteromonas xiamenensis]|uniref:catalase n=1 Tax=Pseudoalteromonas xiamenensis TaxID=882626 RepID=UPI0035E8A472
MKAIILLLLAAVPLGATANQVVPNAAITAFEKKFGVSEGKRRNHTKGLCFAATFTATPEAAQYTVSPIFSGEPISVVGRFSHPGGNLHSEDAKTKVLGMALDFRYNDIHHKMAMLNVPFFSVPTPEAFVEQLTITPAERGAFKAKYPSVGQFEQALMEREAGARDYFQQYYNSIHTFYLVNKAKERQPARWIFYSQNMTGLASDNSLDFAQQAAQKLASGPMAMDMIVAFPHVSDKLNDPTYQWVTSGERVNFGRLQITGLDAECEPVNFDPTLVSPGFELSDDPVLKFRSPAYAISFGKRLYEAAKQK